MPEPKGQNAQRPTPNAQRQKGVITTNQAYDLEERLLNYAAEIIRHTEGLPHTAPGITSPVTYSARAHRRYQITAKRKLPSHEMISFTR